MEVSENIHLGHFALARGFNVFETLDLSRNGAPEHHGTLCCLQASRAEGGTVWGILSKPNLILLPFEKLVGILG